MKLGSFLFISHVAEDYGAAKEIVDDLENHGVSCWIAPRNIQPGMPYDDEIAIAIDNCSEMLLVFSNKCNQSDYIRREVTVAGEAKKKIIPFRIENVMPKGGIRLRLTDLHFIDAFKDKQYAISQVINLVSGRAGALILAKPQRETLGVWNVTDRLKGHEKLIHSAAFSPDGLRIVTASSDNTARIWDAETAEPIGKPLVGRECLFSASFSPDGMCIVASSIDMTATIWDAESRRLIGILKGHEGPVFGANFHPDNKLIVTASWDKSARIWDATSGKAIGTPLRGHEAEVRSAAFSPDGKRIVTASLDETARIWDAVSGRATCELRSHGGVLRAEFSPDGKRIATASGETARIWDASSGKAIGGPLKGHINSVRSAAFSPDGQRIVTASDDETTRVWDATTYQPIGKPLRNFGGRVMRAVFSPDGRRIIVALENKTAVIWSDASGRPLD